jgi:hypothetical protein
VRREPVRMLLSDAIDYAGLFPPAQLDMSRAVTEYASYLESEDAWALGRLVVPATRLEELGSVANRLVSGRARSLGAGLPWRVSAVFGPDAVADLARVQAFNDVHTADREGWRGTVQAIELRASSTDAIESALRVIPLDQFELFIEIPIDGNVRVLLGAMIGTDAFAKVRTGGTASDAFPSSADLARFLAACIEADVPFKATAGLHHPIRGDFALTYAPDSARAPMFGFLNVFLAAALLRAGESEDIARALLEERDAAAVQFDEGGVSWRGRHVSMTQLGGTRDRAVRSFGSCSFREPLDDLASLGML